ncbi:unnamed protein product [Paramecium primaurelia]|uniref:Uncharacterized protein n=1 Tax=Paramecium primaurelia TaxID=5886 RepID=A0A8S1P303_PARPR|nr:unnamed protein product [Paramecium primaurelia]
MRKIENYTGEQARAYKKFAQKAKGSRADFEADLNFNEAPSKFVKSNESKQTLKSIKDQIDYFGYEIEPFNMKNERDVGKFDDGGYFVFDKAKDKSVNDAWLDQLDQSNMFQELQEKAQAENSKKIQKQLKEANKNYERRMQKIRGDGFFSSTKFTSKAEAEEFYKNKQQKNEEEEVEVEVEANQQVEEKEKEQQVIQPEEQEVKLEKLGIDQLKEILYELLEENENANQAMKRVRQKLANNQKKVFKKNVRKDNSQQNDNQNQKVQENNNEAKDEAKQTLDILVDICTIIVKKSNDPSIYNIKKEELIPQKVSRLEEDDIF